MEQERREYGNRVVSAVSGVWPSSRGQGVSGGASMGRRNSVCLWSVMERRHVSGEVDKNQ